MVIKSSEIKDSESFLIFIWGIGEARVSRMKKRSGWVRKNKTKRRGLKVKIKV